MFGICLNNQCTKGERAWTVEEYLKSVTLEPRKRPTIILVRNNFQCHFGKSPSPPNTILAWMKLFRTKVSVQNKNKTNSGHSRSIWTSEKKNGRVFDTVIASPRNSVRRISKVLDISRSTTQRTVQDLVCFSHKIQILHELKPTDYRAHLLEFSGRVLASTLILFLLKHIWWSHECHLLLSVHDKQNMRFLGWEKPTEYKQRPLHSQNITVWAAISSYGVIGPYILEYDNRNPIDVTSLVYKNLII